MEFIIVLLFKNSKKHKPMKTKWIKLPRCERRLNLKHISCYVKKMNTKKFNPEWDDIGTKNFRKGYGWIIIIYFTQNISDQRIIFYFPTKGEADIFLAELDNYFLKSEKLK